MSINMTSRQLEGQLEERHIIQT